MIQFNVLKENLKKNYIYILIFFLYLMVKIILFKIDYNNSYDVIIPIFGVLGKQIDLLILYKIILVLFLVYSFYTYEFNSIYDFILPRINLSKFYLSKILFMLVIIFVINIIHLVICFLCFSNIVAFDMSIIMDSTMYFIIIGLIEVLFINLFKSKFLIFILSFICSYLYFINFKYCYLLCFVLMIIGYVSFRLNVKRKIN